MDNIQNSFGDLERPPSKSNITVWAIIEICVFLFLGIGAIKDIIDVFKSPTGVSILDLVKVCVYALLAVGFCFATYGFFKENSQNLKTGLISFCFGCIGLAIVDFDFGIGSIIKILLLLFFSYVLYKQSLNC